MLSPACLRAPRSCKPCLEFSFSTDSAYCGGDLRHRKPVKYPHHPHLPRPMGEVAERGEAGEGFCRISLPSRRGEPPCPRFTSALQDTLPNPISLLVRQKRNGLWMSKEKSAVLTYTVTCLIPGGAHRKDACGPPTYALRARAERVSDFCFPPTPPAAAVTFGIGNLKNIRKPRRGEHCSPADNGDAG